MRLPARLVLISAFLLCGVGFCQPAKAQTKPDKKAEATVSGKVTVKGKPAPGIVVGMRSSQPAQFDPTFKTTTDRDGNYRIVDLPAGSYDVVPVAPALVISEVNNSRGQAVIVSDGEHVEGIDFELVRGGVITGKVTDADGQPLIEEHINLVPVDQRNQRGPVYPTSVNFQTDDRGIYRIFGIRPGRYKVSIGEGDNNFYGRFGRIRPTFRTIFYPDATDPAKATVIEVDEGAEVTRIDITAGPPVAGFAVNGRVVDESGKPVPNVSIGLSRITVDGNNSSSTGGGTGARTDSQGEFRIEKLPPGKYSISISPPPDSDIYADEIGFDVVDQDVTELIIRSSPGASLSGVVVLEGPRDNRVLGALIQSFISAYTRNETTIMSGRADRLKQDGSFRIGGLHAGTANFSLDATRNVKGLTISRIERDGVVQPNGIQVQDAEQVTGIRVVVTYSNGSIRGVIKVENGTLPSGASLMVQLTKPGYPQGNIRPSMADSRGHFLIEGLPAGDYELMVYAPEWRGTPPTVKQIVTVADGAATEVIVTVDLAPAVKP